MKSIFLIFILLSSRLFCQLNLVPNEDFELSNVYPSGGAIAMAIGTQFAPYDALLNYQNNDFSATDSLILLDIATGCPTLQGGVVYQSAVLNNLVYSLAEVFDPICPEYLDKSMQLGSFERSESSEFVIFPVPNDGSFDIIGELKKDMHLTIINMDGKMVYSQTINEESSVLLIQSNLSNGTYTVLLTDVNEMQLTRIKIVILK
ncbi:MAG: T9SS type A sorting domain-containing protein [Fluviicola sp.]|nr:T9SS type A sorting domain-containing protein [Fluviicola sp.]